jgi:hypothetical protein
MRQRVGQDVDGEAVMLDDKNQTQAVSCHVLRSRARMNPWSIQTLFLTGEDSRKKAFDSPAD